MLITRPYLLVLTHSNFHLFIWRERIFILFQLHKEIAQISPLKTTNDKDGWRAKWETSSFPLLLQSSFSGNDYEYFMFFLHSAILYIIYCCNMLLYVILCVCIDTRWYLLFVYMCIIHNIFFTIIFSQINFIENIL